MATDRIFLDNFPVKFNNVTDDCFDYDKREFCQLAQWDDDFEFYFEPSTSDITVANPDFTSNLTSWTVSSVGGWVWSAGKARFVTTSVFASLSQAFTIIANRTYKITFTVSSFGGDTTDGLLMSFGDALWETEQPSGATSNGTYTVYLKPTSGTLLAFYTNSLNNYSVFCDLDTVTIELYESFTDANVALYNKETQTILDAILVSNVYTNSGKPKIGLNYKFNEYNFGDPATDGCYQLQLIKSGITAISSVPYTNRLYSYQRATADVRYSTETEELIIGCKGALSSYVLDFVNPVTNLTTGTVITNRFAYFTHQNQSLYNSQNNWFYCCASTITDWYITAYDCNTKTAVLDINMGSASSLLGIIISNNKLYALRGNGGSLNSYSPYTGALINTIGSYGHKCAVEATALGKLAMASDINPDIRWFDTVTDTLITTTSLSLTSSLVISLVERYYNGLSYIYAYDQFNNRIIKLDPVAMTEVTYYNSPISSGSTEYGMQYVKNLDLIMISSGDEIAYFNPNTNTWVGTITINSNIFKPHYINELKTTYLGVNATNLGVELIELKNSTMVYTQSDEFSECYNIKTSHECSKQLSWSNGHTNGFGIPNNLFSTPPKHYMRLECELVKSRYKGEQETYIDSAGNRIKYYFSSRKLKELYINDIPEYMHDALAIAIGHEHFYIDGVEYSVEDEEYSPEWSSGIPTLKYAKSRLLLGEYTQNKKEID
jgi:hypothetical protein